MCPSGSTTISGPPGGASRGASRSIFSIARLYPIPRKSLDVYAPYISDVRGAGFCATPCNDPAEPPNATIGFGHELHSGPVTQADIERWGTISRAEAEQILRRDLSNFEDEVNREVRIPINQNQFDAMVSLAFN